MNCEYDKLWITFGDWQVLITLRIRLLPTSHRTESGFKLTGAQPLYKLGVSAAAYVLSVIVALWHSERIGKCHLSSSRCGNFTTTHTLSIQRCCCSTSHVRVDFRSLTFVISGRTFVWRNRQAPGCRLRRHTATVVDAAFPPDTHPHTHYLCRGDPTNSCLGTTRGLYWLVVSPSRRMKITTILQHSSFNWLWQYQYPIGSFAEPFRNQQKECLGSRK